MYPPTPVAIRFTLVKLTVTPRTYRLWFSRWMLVSHAENLDPAENPNPPEPRRIAAL
jgi:hypothetical protein